MQPEIQRGIRFGIRFGILSMYLFTISSCCEKESPQNTSSLIGEIKSVTINYPHETRRGCELTKIIFSVELVNESDHSIELPKSPWINHCDLAKNKKMFSIKSTDKSKTVFNVEKRVFENEFGLSLESSPKKVLEPHSKTEIVCVLLNNVYEAPLGVVYDKYKSFLNSPLEITSSQLVSKTLSFKKAKDFKIILELDDQVIVSSEDSTKMNFKIDPPYSKGYY